MSAYDADRRVLPHPDGSWMVFNNDCTTEWCVRVFDGVAHAFDSHGRYLEIHGGFDSVVHELIGDPR